VLSPGVIYLAPADYHVLIERDHTITLDDSEKINFSRPSIDVTFESAAEIYGSSLLCMLLSGANADGVSGLQAARKKGAYIIVQDPATAEVSYMPRQAVENVSVDLLLNEKNLTELPKLLA
jgi:two-component system chemotaxis response regulator CheB